MLISQIHTYSCPNGCGDEHGVFVAQTVINKNSMRSNRGFGFLPPACRKCTTEFGQDDLKEISFAEEDRAKINAYRARKGWPPITKWTTYQREDQAGTP